MHLSITHSHSFALQRLNRSSRKLTGWRAGLTGWALPYIVYGTLALVKKQHEKEQVGGREYCVVYYVGCLLALQPVQQQSNHLLPYQMQC